MRNVDDFDEPGAAKALGSIMNALDLRARFEARKPVYASGIVLALMAVLGSVIWYSYPREVAQREVMNTPIVRADASDYRVTPAEPGGMAIPYRESTVFNTLRSEEGETAAKVENLLPQPEQPVSRQELFAGLKVEETPPAEGASATNMPVTASGVSQAEEPVKNADASQAGAVVPDAATPGAGNAAVANVPATVTPTPVAEPVSVTAAAAPAAAQPAAAEKPETEAAAAASKTEPAAGVQKISDAPKASAGGYYVQLGSVKSRDGADGEWKKLQKSYAALSPLDMRVQEARLGDKGTFYRIQGGPVTEAEAKSICKSVTSQKPGGCLVVRP